MFEPSECDADISSYQTFICEGTASTENTTWSANTLATENIVHITQQKCLYHIHGGQATSSQLPRPP